MTHKIPNTDGIKDTINNVINSPIREHKELKKLAKEWGIPLSQSIKALLVYACIHRMIEYPRADDVLKLQELIGERNQKPEQNIILLQAIENAVKNE